MLLENLWWVTVPVELELRCPVAQGGRQYRAYGPGGGNYARENRETLAWLCRNLGSRHWRNSTGRSRVPDPDFCLPVHNYGSGELRRHKKPHRDGNLH